MKPVYFAISALACVHLSMALTMHTQKKNLVPQDTELQRITSGSALFDSVTQPALTISEVKTVAESISAAEKPQELHNGVEQEGAFKEKGDKCVVPPPTLDAFKKSDRGEYNGMLFGTGFRQSPTDVVMTTRICTNECCDRCPSDNTIAIGHVSLSADGSSKASEWLNVTEVDTQHEMRFIHSGPEDPRLYTSGKSLNILTTIGDAECDPGLKKPKKKDPEAQTMLGSVRKMHHVSLNDDFSVRKECKIDVPELPACVSQKNWMPLPIGEEQFFVYSVKPFQVLKFDPEACQAKFLESPKVLAKENFTEPGQVRGSSSFVVGKTSEAGTVYVALGHGPAPYPYRLIAVLMKPGSSKPELLAVSCPQHLKIDKKQKFAYPTSILSLNYKQNHAEFMFHIDDREVISTQMKGISKWLDDAESYYNNMGYPAICTQHNIVG